MLGSHIIKKLIVTEKTSGFLGGPGRNGYAFVVDRHATKKSVKRAIETGFDVKVDKVTTLNISGKVKITKGRKGKRADRKKAYVRLQSGYSIDIKESIQ